jgi:hypothetical protein
MNMHRAQCMYCTICSCIKTLDPCIVVVVIRSRDAVCCLGINPSKEQSTARGHCPVHRPSILVRHGPHNHDTEFPAVIELNESACL